MHNICVHVYIWLPAPPPHTPRAYLPSGVRRCCAESIKSAHDRVCVVLHALFLPGTRRQLLLMWDIGCQCVSACVRARCTHTHARLTACTRGHGGQGGGRRSQWSAVDGIAPGQRSDLGSRTHARVSARDSVTRAGSGSSTYVLIYLCLQPTLGGQCED